MWAVFRTLFASFIRRYPLLLDLPQRRTLISDWQGFWTFDREPAWITSFENCLRQLWLQCQQSNQGNTHTHQKRNNPCLSRWQGLFLILFAVWVNFCYIPFLLIFSISSALIPLQCWQPQIWLHDDVRTTSIQWVSTISSWNLWILRVRNKFIAPCFLYVCHWSLWLSQ